MDDAQRIRDGGFTLPEVLVTIAVVALLAGSIAASFGVIARSMPPAEARADDARTLSGLTIFLPEDVGSTPPDNFLLDDANHPTGCAGGSPGLGLLRLTWSSGTRTWNVDYRLETDGSHSRIRRYECAPGGTPTIGTLTSQLPPVDVTTWEPGQQPAGFVAIRDDLGRIVGVTVTVTTGAGNTATMVARSNNPDERLEVVAPPTATPTTTGSPTTTTTVTPPAEAPTDTTSDPTSTSTSTTTTVPPCVVLQATADPVDPTNDRGLNHKTMAPLWEHVDVTTVTEGVCTELVLEFDPDLSDGTYDPQWLSFGWTTTSGSVTIEGFPAGVQWSDGSHTLTLRDGIGNAALAQIDMEVS